MSEIALRNVCKQFDSEHYGVKDFNLDIHDKEFVIFVGPSGCGKSTTLRIIAGLEEITDGELWIDGELSNYLEPKERGMSMVFQNYALYPNMTVYGNMAYALKIRKLPKDEIDRKVHEVAKILEIDQLLDRRPAALSGGQKQRVAIGSAIIRKPKAFLMDLIMQGGEIVMENNSKSKITPYLYLVPCMLIFGIFLFYPFVKTIYLSLYKTNKMGQAKLYVGLGNYKELLQSASFINSLKVTLIFVLIVVVGGMLLGLIAAVLCNKAFPGIRVFSTSYALPMAIASSSAAMIFQIMLHPAVGIVNKLTGLDINWLNDPNTALICVAILTAWLNSGINFLYFSAGLGNIDETIYERASVDGAGSVQQFFSLTLPGLSPIMFYTLVVNIIQAFQSFGQIKILTEGGPNESTNVIVYSIYRDAFFNYRFGSAAAQSVILFVIIMIITLIMFRIEKKGVNY